MRQQTTFLLALSGLSAAQSAIVTNILQPLGSDNGVYGSVVGVESDLTTVALHCPQTETQTRGGGRPLVSDPCAELYSATAFIGPSTFSQVQGYSTELEGAGSATERVELGCALGTKDATCVGTRLQLGVVREGTTTTTMSSQELITTVVEDWSRSALPLTITAGLEKLSGGGAPQTTGTGGGAASTSTSKAGAPMVTARAVLAGVAAVVAAM
ncbi:hypothetical protein B0T14DRAFT_563296 [Immersiella caudata]|uniref:Uncharacterized protein n=1 Tax=Immersiella caudata TaxID=314043 RepID=A0AA39X5C3_9PEZI|nr:hypothetical protein B0T14DRAFT_563296 [Immersiella caudata]